MDGIVVRSELIFLDFLALQACVASVDIFALINFFDNFNQLRFSCLFLGQA